MSKLGVSEKAKYWDALTEGCASYVVVLGPDRVYRFINRMAPGLERDDLIGKKTPFDFVPADQHERVREKFETVRSERTSQSYVVDVPVLDYSVRTEVIPVVAETGEVEGYIQVTHNLSELHRAQAELLAQNAELEAHRTHLDQLVLERTSELRAANERLFEQARRDSLTGLFNRREVFRVLEAESQRVERYGGVVSVLLVDLDFFKSINDQHGHLAGDAVLAHVSAMLQAGVRETDTVGRYGGEEFLVVLPATSLQAAEQLGERLRQRIAETPPIYEGLPIPVTCSVGVASARNKDETTHLVREADEALYKAKAAGRDQVVSAAFPTVS